MSATIDLQHLHFFVFAADTLNFTETAKHFFVSQSTVSDKIRDLEQYLGVKLFIRSKRGVQLTAAGKIYLPEAHALISRSNEARLKVRQTEQGMLGNITIGFLPLRHLMPNILRKFRKRYPKIDVVVHQYYNYEIINEAVKTGNIDIAFNFYSDLLSSPHMLQKKIYSAPLALVTRNDHPFASTGAIEWSSLTDIPFVTLARRLAPLQFDQTMRVCSTRGFFPQNVREVNSADAALVSVESEIGLTILPRYFELYGYPGLCFINIGGPDAQLDVGLTWNKENNNPSLSLFIKEIISHTD
ncbi:MAG: transcriptional regulator AlsR family [Firmicutes bacterium]|nr:transcriptional regulator AlsR family [Bacillota bacterium]